jgi:hypothetical protein
VLSALFDRLEDGLPEWRAEVLRILRQMLPVFMGAGDLKSASRVLIELNALLDAGKLADEHRDDVEALFRELSEPAVLSQLLRSLEEGSIDPKGQDLNVFLRHLGPAAMPVLLAAIERTSPVRCRSGCVAPWRAWPGRTATGAGPAASQRHRRGARGRPPHRPVGHCRGAPPCWPN